MTGGGSCTKAGGLHWSATLKINNILKWTGSKSRIEIGGLPNTNGFEHWRITHISRWKRGCLKLGNLKFQQQKPVLLEARARYETSRVVVLLQCLLGPASEKPTIHKIVSRETQIRTTPQMEALICIRPTKCSRERNIWRRSRMMMMMLMMMMTTMTWEPAAEAYFLELICVYIYKEIITGITISLRLYHLSIYILYSNCWYQLLIFPMIKYMIMSLRSTSEIPIKHVLLPISSHPRVTSATLSASEGTSRARSGCAQSRSCRSGRSAIGGNGSKRYLRCATCHTARWGCEMD